MVQFADSPHSASMRRYEANLRQAKASNQDARQNMRQRIEENLVAGGQEEIDKYRATLDERWKKARCLAEYDGISMGRAIAVRAQKRLDGGGEDVPA